jgi:signal peptidase I
MMAMANYFALWLTLAALLTGIFWVLTRTVGSRSTGTTTAVDPEAAADTLSAPAMPRRWPHWVVWIGDCFPMILLVLVVRSFLYEAYQIPSGSMMPTLLVGDFIVVKKFSYGLREPIFQKQLLATGVPKRGDVAVFKYPEDPSIYFIKRIVGLPGDRVIYRGKRLFIQPAHSTNSADQPLTVEYQTLSSDVSPSTGELLTTLVERLGPVNHQLLISSQPTDLSFYYQQPGEPLSEWVVPLGHYFAMGDNRDNSRDSRFWGFVPESHLVGQAVAIWMSFEKQPESWPTGIRWRRLGAIH